MDMVRRRQLAEFLAAWSPTQIDYETSRPEPKIREGFTLRALVRPLRHFIGERQIEPIENALVSNFSRDPVLADQVDAIWRRYQTNRAFFARLHSTVLTVMDAGH